MTPKLRRARPWFVVMWLTVGAACAANPAPATVAAPPAAAPASSGTSAPLRLTSRFVGAWTGQLEYRDFQSNEQVLLPTWLTIAEASAPGSLELRYVYDDGPSKTVRELVTVAFDAAAATARFTSDRDRTSETYAVEGLAAFAPRGLGTLVLTGPGTENDHPVDVRITLTLRRNLYSLRKETRRPGEDFRFRDGYTFTRAEPPAAVP